jgi:hypothetical protein
MHLVFAKSPNKSLIFLLLLLVLEILEGVKLTLPERISFMDYIDIFNLYIKDSSSLELDYTIALTSEDAYDMVTQTGLLKLTKDETAFSGDSHFIVEQQLALETMETPAASQFLLFQFDDFEIDNNAWSSDHISTCGYSLNHILGMCVCM